LILRGPSHGASLRARIQGRSAGSCGRHLDVARGDPLWSAYPPTPHAYHFVYGPDTAETGFSTFMFCATVFVLVARRSTATLNRTLLAAAVCFFILSTVVSCLPSTLMTKSHFAAHRRRHPPPHAWPRGEPQLYAWRAERVVRHCRRVYVRLQECGVYHTDGALGHSSGAPRPLSCRRKLLMRRCQVYRCHTVWNSRKVTTFLGLLWCSIIGTSYIRRCVRVFTLRHEVVTGVGCVWADSVARSDAGGLFHSRQPPKLLPADLC
jgi:hypothetical protein